MFGDVQFDNATYSELLLDIFFSADGNATPDSTPVPLAAQSWVYSGSTGVNGAASRFVFRDDNSTTYEEDAATFMVAYVVPWSQNLTQEPSLSESAGMAVGSAYTTRRVPGPCAVPAPPSHSGTSTPSFSSSPSATQGTSPSSSRSPYPSYVDPPGSEYYYDTMPSSSASPSRLAQSDLKSTSGATPPAQSFAFLVALAAVVAAALW